MDVHIEELTTSVTVVDDESLLSPAVVNRLVHLVLARLSAAERARGIAEGNTRLDRAAAGRPDMLRP